MRKVTVVCMDNEKQSWNTYWGKEDEHEWWERPDQDVLDLVRSQSPLERPDVLDLDWDNQGVQRFYSNWHVLAEKCSQRGMR